MRTSDESNAMFCSCLLQHTNFDGKRILDIGCGNGDLVKYIARNYSPASVVGIEPFLEDWGVGESEGDNWRIVSGNAHNLDFDDGCFDLVISFSTFEHIADIRKALSEIRRVLRPFGKFYTEFMPMDFGGRPSFCGQYAELVESRAYYADSAVGTSVYVRRRNAGISGIESYG